jgi:hypothetical protein
VPADGGPAVQLTHHGGQALRASKDSEWLYYSPRGRGPIWKIRPDGTGDSECLSLPIYFLGYTLTRSGIYAWVVPEAGKRPYWSVQMFRLNDGKNVELLRPDFPPGMGLSISPDERYLLLTKPDENGTDLLLVEGFR